jgi:hypothetical protein
MTGMPVPCTHVSEKHTPAGNNIPLISKQSHTKIDLWRVDIQ